MHTHMHAYIHAHTHTNARTHTPTRTHTHTHTQTQTHTDIHTHLSSRIISRNKLSLSLCHATHVRHTMYPIVKPCRAEIYTGVFSSIFHTLTTVKTCQPETYLR